MNTEPSRKIRIATVHTSEVFDEFKPIHMNFTRWIRISEALARLGYQVDMIVNTKAQKIVTRGPVRLVPFSQVHWPDYHVVKTLFHQGFQTLASEGGSDHPFIISKLGSVVGSSDATEGVYFFHQEREQLFSIQKEIARRSRFVSILTEASRLLWQKEHGERPELLLVPTGVDRDIPAPVTNPYEQYDEKIAVYIGSLYLNAQREINLMWQSRLNNLGRLLRSRGIRLCLLSLGRYDQIDPEAVSILGGVENDRIWDYHYFADVGIVLAQGTVQHNESSKIYYYLRAGLPVVSEDPVPNNSLITNSKLGLISPYQYDEKMADLIQEATERAWDKERGIEFVLENHTWDSRVKIYHDVISNHFAKV